MLPVDCNTDASCIVVHVYRGTGNTRVHVRVSRLALYYYSSGMRPVLEYRYGITSTRVLHVYRYSSRYRYCQY